MGALYVLTLVNPSFGQVNLSSNNKRALYEAFGLKPLGVTLANQLDYDILLEIRRLRTSLKININSYHVPQPNEGVPEDVKELCTPAVECNAYLQSASLANRAALIASMLPSQVITVIHNKGIVLSPLRALVSRILHRHPLQQKLQRDNNWTEQQYSLIDWPAYQRAIDKHPRSHRISITKLSHLLWNTNQQNSHYYGESSMCPSCKRVTEDTTHIYTCPQLEVVETRTAALVAFKHAMRRITPGNVLESILAGIHQWMANPCLPSYLSPTAGSLLPPLQSITVAFQAQSSIGWGGLFRGHLAKSWTTAYTHNYESPKGKKPPSHRTIQSLSQQWSTKLVLHLWEFSKKIWAYRNAVVHGNTEQSRVSKERLCMQAAVSEHYAAFQDDYHYIPQTRTYLFNRPEAATLSLRRDAMANWLASVEEAVLTQQHRQMANTTKITQFFVRRVTKSDIQVEADLLRPPFSRNYYRRTNPKRVTPTHCRPASKSHPTNKSYNSEKQDNTGQPKSTLYHFGFQTGCGGEQTIPSMGKRQADAAAAKTDYSGTFLSTVP